MNQTNQNSAKKVKNTTNRGNHHQQGKESVSTNQSSESNAANINLKDVVDKIDCLNDNIDSRFNELESKLSKQIDDKINKIELIIKKNSEKIFGNSNMILELQNQMEDVRATVNDLHTEKQNMLQQIQELNALTSTQVVRIKVVEKRNENLANRSTRKTLIIKGIPEESNETWDET